MIEPLKAPMPYFGGKRKVAGEVWKRFGAVQNSVEPFFGSGAVLLARPEPFDGPETVNDADGLLSNFWRALQAAPDEVAKWADWPVNENDLHARHAWLVERKDSLQARLEGDPDYFDAKMAGWWVWGCACWIGSGWCSGNGPWHRVQDEAGNWILKDTGDQGRGVNRKLVHVGDQGRGVNRQLVHVGTQGQGVNRKCVDLNTYGGMRSPERAIRSDLQEYFAQLSDRLRNVRVCCGDWSRVMGESVTVKHGLTAVFLDPPYADTAKRNGNLYRVDCLKVAHDVREWAIANGDNPLLRIALCGYEGEHQMPPDWNCWSWNAGMGYGGQNSEQTGNGKRERVWFSPHCVPANQMTLL